MQRSGSGGASGGAPRGLRYALLPSLLWWGGLAWSLVRDRWLALAWPIVGSLLILAVVGLEVAVARALSHERTTPRWPRSSDRTGLARSALRSVRRARAR